jgi:hypothetical protein
MIRYRMTSFYFCADKRFISLLFNAAVIPLGSFGFGLASLGAADQQTND